MIPAPVYLRRPSARRALASRSGSERATVSHGWLLGGLTIRRHEPAAPRRDDTASGIGTCAELGGKVASIGRVSGLPARTFIGKLEDNLGVLL